MLYAGIGSRSTPPNILSQMFSIAGRLATYNWTLRSGAAKGADRNFELGMAFSGHGQKEIYTPSSTDLHWPTLLSHASQFHPNWPACEQMGEYVCKLHARNSAIILGPNLDQPVDLVICWTPPGHEGGTGQALRIARSLSIPIINLRTHMPSFASVTAIPTAAPIHPLLEV